MAQKDCPKRMYEADLCCTVHDSCYMDESKGRAQCDDEFCHCLERTVAQAKTVQQTSATSVNVSSSSSFSSFSPSSSSSSSFSSQNKTTATTEEKKVSPRDGCSAVSSGFCGIVNMFGAMAYASSLELVKKQRAAMAAWEKAEQGRKRVAAEEAKRNKTAGSASFSSISLNKGDAASPDPTLSSSSSTTGKEQKHVVIAHKFPIEECSDKRELAECSSQFQKCNNNLLKQFGSSSASLDKNASSDKKGTEFVQQQQQKQQQNSNSLLLSAELAECSSAFCKCASDKAMTKKHEQQQNKNGEKNGEEKENYLSCAQKLVPICAQFAVDFNGRLALPELQDAKRATYVNLWSVNVNHNFGQPLSIGLAIASTLLTLLVVAVFFLLLSKILSALRRRLKITGKKRKNYVQSTIRRNTLISALRHVGATGNDESNNGEMLHGRGGGGSGVEGPLYMPLSNHHQKASTVSSPTESVAASQQLLLGTSAHQHNHKKTHSDCNKNKNNVNGKKCQQQQNTNFLHSSIDGEPNNSSSQAHLIGAASSSAANSSSTLSDISSA